jgi:hypothetical protein
MELDDAIHTAILTLKEGYLISMLPLLLCYFVNIITDKTLGLPACRYEGQISSNNIEIGIIRSDREFRYVTPRFGPWFLTLVFKDMCFTLTQLSKIVSQFRVFELFLGLRSSMLVTSPFNRCWEKKVSCMYSRFH